MKKLFSNIPLTIYCILFMFGAFLSWCFLTISYRDSLFLVLSAVSNLILMFIFSIVIRKCDNNAEMLGQLKVVVIIIGYIGVIISLMLFPCVETGADLFIAIACLCWAIWSSFAYRTINRKKTQKKDIETLIKSKKFPVGIVILLLITIFLAYEETGYQFKWDGLLYYKSCQNISLSSISSLALYGHISQTYAGIVALFNLIFKDVGVAMIVVNYVLLLVAIFFYYQLIKMIIPDRNEIFYLMATAVLAFSPYFLGMVNYFSLDFCLICLFPAVLYFTFSKKWIFQLFVAVLFCFTKETAVIIYAGLCLGIVIVDWCSRRSFCEIIKTKHYYTMALPGVLWFLTFSLLGPWTAGESAVTFDISYIIDKLQILYVFQFNWIFSLVILFCCVYSCLKNKCIEINNYIFPLAISQLFFSLFSCLFRTVNHPRYIDTSVIFLYFVATYCLAHVLKQKNQEIFSGVIASLLLISCYKTIDIVSTTIFEQVSIGQDRIITTYELPFGDGAIYNKQMLWMEGAMNQAIGDALADDDIIVVPAINDSTYSFDGASDLVYTGGGYYTQCQYWNNVKHRREVLKNGDNQAYELYQISDKAHISIIPNMDNRTISFICVDLDAENCFKNVLKNANIISEQSYSYRGWVLTRIRVQPEAKSS